MDFGLLKGSPEGHFGGHFGAMFANRSDYVDFLVIFFRSRKNERKRSSPGGGHAIRACLCMFREDRPLLPWLHFWLHFGVILGAKFATMLFFVRRSHQQGPQTGTFLSGCFFVDFRVPSLGG